MEGEFYQGGQDEDLLHLIEGNGAPLTSTSHYNHQNTVHSNTTTKDRVGVLIKKTKLVNYFIQTKKKEVNDLDNTQ